MPDTGYRSIEIFVSNDTAADLSVPSATLNESSTWIPGEEIESAMVVEELGGEHGDRQQTGDPLHPGVVER